MLLAQSSMDQTVDARMISEQEKRNTYYCPACHSEVILRRGMIVVSHFAHKRGADCHAYSEGETAEHIAGKELLLRFFPKAQMEVYLPNLVQRPDVLLERTAFEFQCSTLRYVRFIERTQNYLMNAFHPVWLVGHRFSPHGHFTTFQKGCCAINDRLGIFLYELDTTKEQLIRYQQINWRFETGYTFEVVTRSVGDKWTFDRRQRQNTRNKESYPTWIQRQLMRQDPLILSLQDEAYSYGYCLFDLPDWCYEESIAGFYFTHHIILFQIYFLISRCKEEWFDLISNRIGDWLYPFIEKYPFLDQLYHECHKLSENS